MTGLDRAAARHVEQIVDRFYRGRIPPRIRRHLDSAGSDLGTKREVLQGESTYEPIGTTTAAELLDCSARYVTRIAADLDGIQIDGGVWVFDRAAVTEYVAAKSERKRRDCA